MNKAFDNAHPASVTIIDTTYNKPSSLCLLRRLSGGLGVGRFCNYHEENAYFFFARCGFFKASWIPFGSRD